MIIGAEEGPSHHFVHGDEAATKYPTILSPPTLHQEGAIIIEKEQWGVHCLLFSYFANKVKWYVRK